MTPTFPNTVMDMPNLSTDAHGGVGPERTFKESIAHAAYEEAGIGPEDVSLAEVYDLSTALELDWIEDLALCKRGEAESLLRAGETTLGGRIPVNPSGGLACFGEAVPAQALAQVCEVTWQLRGQAEGRQVEGARVGITANQGLFGHGSSVHPERLTMSFVLVDRPDPEVAVVTLNRPERMNAMAFDVMVPLRDALAALHEDNTVRAVVLTGAGAGFCSGADQESAGVPPGATGVTRPTYALRAMEMLEDVVLTIRRLHQPVIAAVNGAAIGGGLCLALACDLRIAAPAAYFRAAGINNGLTASELGL